jgi:nitrogenase subunit NifH
MTNAVTSTQKKATKLGIWLDHSSAHLMEFTTDPIETTMIESEFTHEEKQHSMGKGEGLMHHKEQQKQASYYKKLGEIIINYEDVLIFGPTDAKVELLNTLRVDHRFVNIKMTVEQADKMTENQKHAFVREYFSKHHQ